MFRLTEVTPDTRVHSTIVLREVQVEEVDWRNGLTIHDPRSGIELATVSNLDVVMFETLAGVIRVN